jgi:hypothetical protein
VADIARALVRRVQPIDATPRQSSAEHERGHVGATCSGDPRVVARESALVIVRIQMEQRAVPGKMDRQSGTLAPCRFDLGKKRQAITDTALHMAPGWRASARRAIFSARRYCPFSSSAKAYIARTLA